MPNRLPMPPKEVLESLRKGGVIPAHPLALNRARKLDERRQRGLSRYYMAAGADGLAVGVHTTQFAIRDSKVGLFRPVLELAAETMTAHQPKKRPPVVRVAGICGDTRQAVAEARLAADLGYHIGLLSLGALSKAPADKLIEHARAVSEILPLMGFYLQPSVGGRILNFDFWRRFVEIENVVAVKIAPFNRYQTLDVVRALVEAGRAKEVALYTGNDDNIINDLLTQFQFGKNTPSKPVRFAGGLLGHWAVWTRRAVAQLLECHRIVEHQRVPIPPRMLTIAAQVTDTNAAFFDPAHGFAGCIAGIHEVLRRQGLLEGIWCLDPKETLSPGQIEEIDRVYAAYPHLNDDAFVAEHRDFWLA
jgi:dihydrodipicolinate synthase/N-acetylneuraminate lyase